MPNSHTPFDLSNLQVLLVEDNKYMQLLLQNVLRMFKMRRIQTADDGAEALSIMKAFHPDIIFCDWSMEVIDGVEFTRLVRTGVDTPNPYVPIIMLTGHSEMNRIYEARDAGITEYVIKPISAEMIYERICRVIERPRQFVRSKAFFGPDRRRSKSTRISNKGRRQKDKDAEAEAEAVAEDSSADAIMAESKQDTE